MADQAPPGVNMPKKRDPRLRQVQAPPQQKFFDSADYEVRKQQHQDQHQHAGQQQSHHSSHSQMAPNGIPHREPADVPRPGALDDGAPRDKIPPPPQSEGYVVQRARRTLQ
ncbi:hypothetical protein MNV84_06660 [Leishmania braziliensis]|nr:hypothetical protein MNV84_06660 [Leishmania braziliensis]